jgi:hypothetical protein
MKVVMTYNRSVVDNLIPIKNREKSADFFLKKIP